MPRRVLPPTLVLACLSLLPTSASADRRYFVDSYTPYLAEAGERELEVWTTALSGQGDSANTAWENRAEFEYAITDRLTGAAYLNFAQTGSPEAPMHFEGPSVELIYRFGAPGQIPLDPAAYLEVRENGDELEVEPKLLLAHRRGALVAALNLIGELEFHHQGNEETEKSFAVTAGLSREWGPTLAVGLESVYRRRISDAPSDPTALFAGPTINLHAHEVQVSLGWHPQVWGSPASVSHLDLADFPRSEVRLILGVDL
jgi:hypothetical protein